MHIFRHTIAIIALLFASACVHAEIKAPAECPPMSGNDGLRLTVDQYRLGLNNNKPICTVLPGTFRIKVRNPPNADHDVQAGDITIEQKAGAPFSISGDNSADKDYVDVTVAEFVTIPETESDCDDGTGDECAKFWIKVKGVGELDPKVRVVDATKQMIHQRDTLAEVFDDLGLTLDEVNAVFRNTEQ